MAGHRISETSCPVPQREGQGHPFDLGQIVRMLECTRVPAGYDYVAADLQQPDDEG